MSRQNVREALVFQPIELKSIDLWFLKPWIDFGKEEAVPPEPPSLFIINSDFYTCASSWILRSHHCAVSDESPVSSCPLGGTIDFRTIQSGILGSLLWLFFHQIQFYWFPLCQFPGHRTLFLLPFHPHLNPINLCLSHYQLFFHMNLTYSHCSSDIQFYGNHNSSKHQTIQCFSVLGLNGNSRWILCL